MAFQVLPKVETREANVTTVLAHLAHFGIELGRRLKLGAEGLGLGLILALALKGQPVDVCHQVLASSLETWSGLAANVA